MGFTSHIRDMMICYNGIYDQLNLGFTGIFLGILLRYNGL